MFGHDRKADIDWEWTDSPSPEQVSPLVRLLRPFGRPVRRRRAAGSGTRFSHRLGPVCMSLSRRRGRTFLRISLWGTGLSWEVRL